MDMDQQCIIEADTEKHVRVTACPGAGKSRTLVHRVIHLVTCKNIPTSKVRVVTFSRQASADVSARLPDGVKSSTIHSFCLELAEAFDPVLRRARFFLPNACPWSANGEVLEARFVASEKETYFCNAESEVFLPDEHIYRLLRAFRTPVDKETSDSIRSLVPHFLLIDEAQDLDQTQFDVIQLLVERYATRVFAVGDVNQNIYAFRMSDASLLGKVERLGTYPCDSFELLNNYRSTEALVGFCNEIRPDPSSHPMRHVRTCNSDPPKLAVFEDRAEELRFVTEKVAAHASKTDGDLGEIAIIARTQREVYTMAHKLTELGYSTKVYTGDSEPAPVKRKGGECDHITLCTMHGAKGLEWSSVIVIGCTDMLNRCLTTEELDQERNLFYVACTRAKDSLLITSPSRCITRLLFPASRASYDLVTDDEKSATPIFGTFGDTDGQLPPNRSVTNFVRHASGEFYDRSKQRSVIPRTYPGATFQRLHAVHGFPASGDTNILYGSAVERVIYRQVMSSCLRERGLEGHPVRMTDHFADKCFLWVKAFEDNWTLPEPTPEQVETMVRNLAAEFEVDPRKVVMHSDARSLPAFARSSKDSLLRTKRFEDTLERIRESYKDYIRFDHDTESRRALRKITDVAVCAHLVYPPARTYFAFADLHLGDLSKDKNLGLFGCTKRFVESIIRKHLDSYGGVDMLPVVITPDDMYQLFGVATDVDLSTESLRGVADLIVGNRILDIKCSAEKSGIQAQWVLQLLTYAALARLKGMEVDEISIYNPIQGYVWTAPIDSWQRHEELLKDINDEISSKRSL